MVVDDLKVSDDIAFCQAAEPDLWLGFPRPLRKNGEVSGFTDLHTCGRGAGEDSGLTIWVNLAWVLSKTQGIWRHLSC